MEGEPIWLQVIVLFLAIVVCPYVGIWVVKDIIKDIKNMRAFGEEMFGEINEDEYQKREEANFGRAKTRGEIKGIENKIPQGNM